MKKLILLFVFAGLVTAASAQVFVRGKDRQFVWGPKVGLNVSHMTRDARVWGNYEAGAKAGFTGGLFAEYYWNPLVGLSADLLYSSGGGQLREEGVLLRVNLNYLTIPVLVNCRLFDGFSLKLGLQPGFNLGGKSIFKYKGDKVSSKAEDMNPVDLAIPVGVSYDFDFGLRLDARYNFGVTNIFKNDDDVNAGSNSIFAFTVGWIF